MVAPPHRKAPTMNLAHMSHILHVLVQDCGGLEASHDLGHFLPHQLQEALDCAKAALDPHEAVIIRMVPLGTYKYGECRVVWYHDPKECRTCPVCVKGRYEPLFRHDCSQCEYMGSMVDSDGRNCDLYVHEANDEYIARYSDTGCDYIAHDKAIASQFTDRPTHEALKRWTEREANRKAYEASEAAQAN